MAEIDYMAVLADMEAKRDALSTTIENMKSWLGVGVTHASSPNPVNKSNNGEFRIESDSFFGLNVPEATKKYLSLCKAKRSTLEITQALEQGGLKHTSKNFKNSVATALYREDEKPNGEIVKVGEG